MTFSLYLVNRFFIFLFFQERVHIFPSLLFVIEVFVEALPLALDILGQIQFWNLMKLKSTFILLTFGHLTVVPVLGMSMSGAVHHGHSQQRDRRFLWREKSLSQTIQHTSHSVTS